MPELPEVETVVNTLSYRLHHPKILAVNITYPKLIDNISALEFERHVIGQSIQEYHRHGKYIIFVLDDFYLISHMRMEGKYYIQNPNDFYDQKHVHIIFSLDNGKELRYHDTRKFGRMYLYPKQCDLYKEKVFQNIGKDALDPNISVDYLYQNWHHRSITLKQALLEQHVIAGIGNIYADEICFALKKHPGIKVNRLRKKDLEYLIVEMRRILNGAIASGGTTIRSYTSSLEVSGRFQLKLKVHMKKDQLCSECGSQIKKIKLATRGTYFCPSCQKKR